jgi:hypothetical protein
MIGDAFTKWSKLPLSIMILSASRYTVTILPVLYDVAGEIHVCELIAQEYTDVNFIIPHLAALLTIGVPNSP